MIYFRIGYFENPQKRKVSEQSEHSYEKQEKSFESDMLGIRMRIYFNGMC